MKGGARGCVAVPPKAHSSSNVETSDLSHVEQEGLLPMPKDRGAEQRDVDGFLECSLALGMVGSRGARKHCRTASGGHPSLDKHERLCRGTETCKQATRPDCSNQQTSSMVAQQSSLVFMARGMRCRKAEAWRTSGAWMTMTSRATQPWCCPFCRTSTLPMPESEPSRNPRKTEVIYFVNDLMQAPPEWKIGDVWGLGQNLRSYHR